ncbi:hypothetical protein KY313_01330, partial [Candidatus Woesearchaeota archaeon]|nr:hypothetical protein [Candidatus Woesearchaeota archaeon]
ILIPILLLLFVSPLLAEEDFITPEIMPSEEPTEEPPTYPQDTSYKQQQEKIGFVFWITSLIFSLIIGIALTIFMIKGSSKKIALFIQGLLFLGSLIWFISMIFSLFSQLIRLGGIPDPDIIENGWPILLLLVISGYFIFSIIRKENFTKKMKYTLGLFSGAITTSILAIISLLVLGTIFQQDAFGISIMFMIMLFFGGIGSIVLGIIGFIIDKIRK